jgi:predicted transcriptional regulator of viral defense system
MKQTILSSKQAELLENLIVKYGQIVTSAQINKEAEVYWGYQQAKNSTTRLTKAGWLIRIKQGLYAISDLGSRGSLSLSPIVVANLLVPDSYVSFESALQHHGMVDQLLKRVVSVSERQHKTVSLSGTEYAYVKTRSGLYFGWQDAQVDGVNVKIAVPEKALADLVNFHKTRYSIDLVTEKIIEYKDDLDFDQLNSILSKYSTTTRKIFGFIYDLLGVDSSILHRMVNTRVPHWMIPGDDKFNAKWRLYYSDYFDKYIAA